MEKTTRSLCPKCLKEINAKIIEKNGMLYLTKKCDKHGYFEAPHILNYPPMYKLLSSIHKGKKYSPEGLLIFLTRDCNQNCPFCFERALDKKMKPPTIQNIIKKSEEFKGDLVYFGGGEPTVRDDLPEIIKQVKKTGKKVGMFSNGKKLADRKYVKELKKAGLDFVIMQFDSLKNKNYEKLRAERLVKTKRKAIQNLQEEGIYANLYAMLIKGINDDEIGDLIEYTKNKSIIKILFLQAVWQLGRQPIHKNITMQEIYDKQDEKLKTTFEDTKQSTIFAHYFFEIMQKLGVKKGHKEPMCSTNLYILRDGNKLIPLSKLLNLQKLNKELKTLNESHSSKIKTSTKLTIIMTKHFLNRACAKYFIKQPLKIIKTLIKSGPMNFMFLDMFSIVVGQSHDAFNVDLDATDTCNLYSDFPNDRKEPCCNCIRQIICETKKW